MTVAKLNDMLAAPKLGFSPFLSSIFGSGTPVSLRDHHSLLLV